MKILVGLSGGVDSAVAAYLLKEQGHDVTCAFMRNWDSASNNDVEGNPTVNDDVCPQETDYQDAVKAAEKLGLPLMRVDYIKEYWDDVFETFLSEYKKGRTPNPDILCNRYIKFDRFYHFAEVHGFEKLATGHYCDLTVRDGRPALYKASDRNKDQSYFLGEIRREVLDHILFPLGKVTKPEVRRIAHELDLSVADKKDSTGICFIGERDFRRFLSNYLPMKHGRIINIETGETVGEHKGVLYYTVGQRKGLDIGGIGPFFVAGKDVVRNELYVVGAGHEDLLYSDACLVEDVNWLMDECDTLACTAKFRYRQPDQDVVLEWVDASHILLKYPQTVRSVTCGQEAVVYDHDAVRCAGRICAVYKNGRDISEIIKGMMQNAG